MLLLGTSIFIIPNIKLYAQEQNPSPYYVELNIRTDKSIEGVFEINLTNSDKNNLINGYELNLPFKINTVTTAQMDGRNIDKNLVIGNDYSDIRLSFFQNAIKPSQTVKIKINFLANELLSSKYGVEYLYIPTIKSNHTSNSNVIYKIRYPDSFNLPTFISPQENLANNANEINLSTTQGLIIIWGDQLLVNLESSFKIENKDNRKINTLVGLPYEDNGNISNVNQPANGQTVYYKSMSNEQNGLIDELENNFIYSALDPNQTKEIKFNARINLSTNIYNDIYPQKYGWKLKDTDQTGEMLKILNSEGDNLQRLKSLNNYLISKMQVYPDETIDLNKIDSIWTKLEGSSKFNSFELCYLMIAASEYLGLPSRMDYGYLIIPEGIVNNGSPHIWCEVKINGKDVLMDPYLETQLHINYFNQVPIDRIRFGIWHPNQSYNNILGLLGDFKSKSTVKISQAENLSPDLKNLSLSLNFPSQAYSGEFYSGIMSVKNNSNKILIVKEMTLNDESVLRQLKLNNLTISFLPQQNNTTKLNYLREKNFLYDGDETLQIRLTPQSKELSIISTTNVINFLPDKRLLILILLVVVLIILILMIIVYRISKPNKIYLKPW